MARRFAALWFPYLTTDWFVRRNPELKDATFVLAAPRRGRMTIRAAGHAARQKGITAGMVVADSRAIFPELQVINDIPGQEEQLLRAMAAWCLRYTPVAATDSPDGLLLDISGCPHLWGGEAPYLEELTAKLCRIGYEVRPAIADTIGAAWAISRYGKGPCIIDSGMQAEAIRTLPPAALRLDAGTTGRLDRLGLRTIGHFMNMPRPALRRRFGPSLLTRLDQALGHEIEALDPVQPPVPYLERLPCPEPIRTATGIGIALRRLLEALCARLEREELGMRSAVLKAFRIDGNIQQISIGTACPSRNAEHLFRLFDLKIGRLQPDLGFELFILEAPVVEALTPLQEMLWNTAGTGDEKSVAELLDRIAGRFGINAIHRYLPDEHYWPERSYRPAASLTEEPETAWRSAQRPVHLLPRPEQIEVTVALPDYPPMLFRYGGRLLRIVKADGPERIEREWWLDEGEYRDYYCVEDEAGARYWLFRLGSYAATEPTWYLHGFFA